MLLFNEGDCMSWWSEVMSRKREKKRAKKQKQSPELDMAQIDEDLLLDPNFFYWNFIRPAEESDEERRQKRAARRARQKDGSR
jgi:hypothetical protein